ncbi:dihydrolipoyl dehydrogenase [Paenibacillus sp. PK4536]|uniref:dihydrolipoyl dehydrogenase n=1 Tax=unclassified Paenibacillus TaxID=185978 RepID=UPI0010C005A5|nr:MULTISPECIES: dihydrolipoyl dehydrogenase [unclassified Paenibacillus]TKJ94074.1 dihydrolipoyl dehydrogenase [Paenibacillus sp. CFBP13512]WIM38839.1 dihydrolipoyl dehydrogenase [Paenibacillus sp. PK4536]
MTINCDIAILGGGTGGYVAAIRAAQLGKEVVIIEQDKLGGTCLHRGCIPSKSLLRSAEVYALMQDSEDYGIAAENITLQFAKVQARKQGIVDQLHQGVQYLMRKNKIKVVQGKGRVIGPSIFSPQSGAVAVEYEDGEMETVVSKNLIIATGSRPRVLPGLEADGQLILNSDHALQLESLPESMLIVGGGVIGMEWASMLNDFGVKITVVEAAPQILPAEDQEVARELRKLLEQRGVTIYTDATLLTDTYAPAADQQELSITIRHQEQEHVLTVSKVFVSIGRQANAESIGLANTDVQIVNGFIKVNSKMQTTESHIYAIGDVIGGLQLAHAASHEGIAAVNHICGEEVHYNPLQVSRCVYTRPEVASTGITEQEATAQGIDVKVGKFPFKAIGKALVYGESDGFVKVIADRNTDDLLGVQIIGPQATDLISEAALAQFLNATPWEVAQTVHAHPTLAEILGEAMLAVDGKALGM